jgi:serine phosphatase RsbU (regulator of sigma subunit)
MRLATALPHAGPAEEAAPALDDEPVNILLVDDQPRNLESLEAVLGDLGQNLVRAGSGPEALRHLLQRDFAAILMDVHMPGMDGLEAASLIRQRQRSRHTPIIFVTAYEDADHVFRGYELGAIDYLIKPINSAILRGKVAVLVDLFQMNRRVKRQAEQIREMERLRIERELTAARERWEAERFRAEAQVARQVQEQFFPLALMPLPGFHIGGGSFPVEAAGGDYFDYIRMVDDSVGVVIGDVSGHGFGPALLMAAMRSYLRALTLTRADIAEILGLLNRAFCGDVPEGRFATLFLGQIDVRKRSFTYVSAGHPTGYLLDSAGRIKRPLGSTGVPLGILPEEGYIPAEAIPLADGDLIALVTDGILEAPGRDGTQFGAERFLGLIRANRMESPRTIVSTLYQGLRDYSGANPQSDDMTAIVVKVDPSPTAGDHSPSDQLASETLPQFAT